MAKEKSKPAKKAEPAKAKAKAAPKKETPKEEIKVKAPVKEKKPKKAKKEKVEKIEKKVAPVQVSQNRAHIANRYQFPKIEDCKHDKTIRTMDRRMRVMRVCANPACKKVVKYGAR